eukprot:scaffold5261_cov108-Skeletonema_menzelii.AAC.2
MGTRKPSDFNAAAKFTYVIREQLASVSIELILSLTFVNNIYQCCDQSIESARRDDSIEDLLLTLSRVVCSDLQVASRVESVAVGAQSLESLRVDRTDADGLLKKSSKPT